MSVGVMLRQARAAAGVSIEQLSDSTRVRTAVLRAMENDDFSACGGDAYARGQLRSIARALRVDPEPLLFAFEHPEADPVDPDVATTSGVADSQVAGTRAGSDADTKAVPSTGPGWGSTPSPTPPEAPRHRSRRPVPIRTGSAKSQPNLSAPERGAQASTAAMAAMGGTTNHGRDARSGPNWTLAMAVALVAILVVIVLGFAGRDGSTAPGANIAGGVTSSPTSTATGPAAPSAPPTTAPTSPGPSISSPDTVAQVPDKGVTVKIDGTGGKSWLSVSTGRGGKILYEGLITQGETKSFTNDTRLRVVVGNAGAVSLVVNGRDLGTPGRLGSVKRLEFGPGDPADQQA